jgi:hypothetical protein
VIQTLNATHDAVREQLKALALVGGFVNSVFLREMISKIAVDNGLEFLIPEGCSSAVLNVALRFGVSHLQVQSRVSQRTYGIKCMVPFIAGNDLIHVEKEQVFCMDVFSTIFPKGAALLPNAKWSEIFIVNERSEKWKLQLFAHDENPESVRHFRSAKIELKEGELPRLQ